MTTVQGRAGAYTGKPETDGLKLVTDNEQATIVLNAKDGTPFTLQPDSKEARCVRLGVMLALEQMGSFPHITFDEAVDE